MEGLLKYPSIHRKIMSSKTALGWANARVPGKFDGPHEQ